MSESGFTDSAVRLYSWPENAPFHSGRGRGKLIKPPVPAPISCLMAGGKAVDGPQSSGNGIGLGVNGVEKFAFHWQCAHPLFWNWNWPHWSKMLWIWSWLGEKDIEKKVGFHLSEGLRAHPKWAHPLFFYPYITWIFFIFILTFYL